MLGLSMRAALWMSTLIALPAALRAQAPASDVLERGQRSLGMWAGASLSSSAVFGTITDRRLFLSGLRLEYVLESTGAVTTTYTLDVHPLAVVTNTPRYGLQRVRDRDGTFVNYLVESGRSSVIGAGMSPLGLQFYSRARRGARLFGGGSAGAIWFNREMPVAYARRFNFALQLGGGAEVATEGGVLVLGYKFHHLSNAGTAPSNPGMDGHVFYVGVMRRPRVARGGGELAGQ
jgi:Lipid A 3-O-deacylase (PagL)